MRNHRQASSLIVAVLIVSAVTFADAQGQARLDGKWLGTVTSDIGELDIEVTLQVTGHEASGSIRSAHGEFPIKGGVFADGTWTLPFYGDGFEGRLIARLKGDSLTGDWINPGITTGTFALTRSK